MSNVSAPNAATAVVQSVGTLPDRPTGAAAPAVAVQEVRSTAKTGQDTASSPPPTRDAVDRAARQIDSFVKATNRNLNFSLDESLGVPVVRVVDPNTQEVIRQIPAEETLQIAKSLEFLNSVMVQQKA